MGRRGCEAWSIERKEKGEFLCVYREKKGERRVRDGIAFLTVILCVTMTNEMYKWRTVIKKEKKGWMVLL